MAFVGYLNYTYMYHTHIRGVYQVNIIVRVIIKLKSRAYDTVQLGFDYDMIIQSDWHCLLYNNSPNRLSLKFTIIQPG